MSDKKRRSQAAIPADVPTMTLREFLRGGYQRITEPTLVLYHSAVLGTFVPGVINTEYDWLPNAMLAEGAGEADAEPPRPMLARLVAAPPSAELPQAARAPDAAAEARDGTTEPATRRAYRRLRRTVVNPAPLYIASTQADAIHAEPPALPTTMSDPAWLTGSIKRSTRRTTKGG
jgi:hypothetical protein